MSEVFKGQTVAQVHMQNRWGYEQAERGKKTLRLSSEQNKASMIEEALGVSVPDLLLGNE